MFKFTREHVNKLLVNLLKERKKKYLQEMSHFIMRMTSKSTPSIITVAKRFNISHRSYHSKHCQNVKMWLGQKWHSCLKQALASQHHFDIGPKKFFKCTLQLFQLVKFVLINCDHMAYSSMAFWNGTVNKCPLNFFTI